jgi:hypothetical protein
MQAQSDAIDPKQSWCRFFPMQGVLPDISD